MQLARNFMVLKASQHFGQTGHSRSVFQMTDVGLHGTYQARRIVRSRLSQHAFERVNFNWVADRCARAMGFHVSQFARGDSSLSQGLADDGLLGGGIGSGDARGAAVLVHGRSSNESKGMVALAERGGEALEDDRAGAFGANVAVGPGVERFAAAVRG